VCVCVYVCASCIDVFAVDADLKCLDKYVQISVPKCFYLCTRAGVRRMRVVMHTCNSASLCTHTSTHLYVRPCANVCACKKLSRNHAIPCTCAHCARSVMSSLVTHDLPCMSRHGHVCPRPLGWNYGHKIRYDFNHRRSSLGT